MSLVCSLLFLSLFSSFLRHGSKFDVAHPHHTSFTSWKDNLKSGLQHETFRGEHEKKVYHYHSEPTPLHSLTSKPSFENMTVEEICEEIRKIKSAEVRM